MKNTVSLVKCENYEYKLVYSAVKDAFNLLGGLDNFVKKGSKVLLKPNLLTKKRPEQHTTTNPAVLKAVIEQVQEAGGIVTVADSPGGPYTQGMLKVVYRASEIEKVCLETGAILNYDVSSENVTNLEGERCKGFQIINPVLDADIIINLPKFKSHSLTMFTGSVKNLFGVIPGVLKAEYHYRFPQTDDFCHMLLDICEFVKPTLTLMDGINGMEGNGPSAGIVKEIGYIIASTNPYALDKVACEMAGLQNEEVPTLKLAVERNIGPASLEEIEILGEDIELAKMEDFLKPESLNDANFKNKLPKFLYNIINKWFTPKVVVDKKICIGCKICKNNCPADAIEMVNNIPDFDYGKCIKCFCCQELCPEMAIRVKRTKIAKL